MSKVLVKRVEFFVGKAPKITVGTIVETTEKKLDWYLANGFELYTIEEEAPVEEPEPQGDDGS